MRSVILDTKGLKLDGCGPADNLTRWNEIINATEHAVMVENCHWGLTVPRGNVSSSRVSQLESVVVGTRISAGPPDDDYCAGLEIPSECAWGLIEE